MAGSTLTMSSASATLPRGRSRRNSYLETLNDISSELDFIRLNQQSSFMPRGSPNSPLSATKTVSFVFEGNTVPTFGSNRGVQQQQHHHYKEPGSNTGRSTLPHSSPYYQKIDSSSPAADYKAITTGIQSLTVNLKQPAGLQNRIAPISPLSPPVSSPPAATPPAATPPASATAHPMSPRSWNTKVAVTIPERKVELTPMTRILHSKPIWYLPNRQRAAAAHYLQPHPVGTFVVRQGRQKHLVLTMKHPGTIPYIQNYPLHTTPSGKLKWDKSNREFDKIEDLVDYHMLVEEGLPCRLVLPEAIMKAKNIRELQSLAVFEEEFWKRGHNTTSPLIASAGPTSEPASMLSSPPVATAVTSTSTSASNEQPSSPFQAPPMYKPPYQILPVVTESQRKPNNYLSMMSPMSPLLARAEYVNMPPSPKSASPILPPQGSQTPFHSYSSLTGIEQSWPYQSWSFENQLKGTPQQIPLESRESTHSQRLSVPLGRQPMRYSTQSERDSLVNNADRRYPPPSSAPPPPPSTLKGDVLVPSQMGPKLVTPLASRQSDAYYKPHEFTRYGHNQMFSSPPPVTSAPPVPDKSRSRVLSMYPPYQMPSTTLNTVPLPSVYADPGKLPAAVSSGYSSPQNQSQQPTLSPVSQETEDQQRLSDSGVCLLEPIRVSGPSTPKEDPLKFFDPLTFSETRTVHESMPEEHIPSIDLKSENLNMNSNSDNTNPNSNNHGAKPVVLTGNLITLYDEDVDPTDELPESEESPINSEEEMMTEESEATTEANVEETTASGSDRTSGSSQEILSVGIDVNIESQEPAEDNKKPVEAEKSKKKDGPRKSGLTSMKKSIHKFVKKKKIKLEKKNKNLKVVAIRKTYRKKIDPAKDIRVAIDRLATNPDSSFSALLEEFIQNAREKGEMEKPDVMMRNVRQFMSGMKNFLFNRQVPEVDLVMDKYPDLSMSELDAIVEGALHLYILKPLKDDIYQCFVNELKRNGSLAILDHNIQIAKSRSMEELGIKPNYVPPAAEAMSEIRTLITEMEESFSPIKKLDYLLKVVTSVYNSVVDKKSGRDVAQSMGADDFLPMFIYVLVQCEAVNIEVEADYMWGLLEPSKLSGEGGYYLTTLSSAICILKQFEEETQSETKGFLCVMVAFENDEIMERTIPVLPGMTAADICRIISHKMQIDNAEDDYYLYLLTDEEVPLASSCCPMYVKTDIEANEDKLVRFGYKHKKHQVKWPPPKEE